MPAKTEDRTEEVRQLRSCLNDLLSLLALPAMWSGREPSQIIETLLDSLLGVLRLDLIYGQLNDPAGDSPIEAVRIAQRLSTHRPQDIGRALEACLTPDGLTLPIFVSNPVGEGQVRIARYSLGLREETGLVIAGSRRPDFPTETETLLIKVAANQAAIALEGAQLANRRKQAEKGLREQTEVVETINRIGQTLSAELDQQKLVQALTDAATELTGAAFGSFFYNVSEEHGESYMLYTLSGAPREAFAHFPMPRNTDIFGPTFRGGGVIRIADVKKDPRYGKNSPYYGMPPGHLPVTSYLAVPVVSRSGEVLGGLFFGHPEAGVFTERHERMIVGLAAQAAIAMDNARLFELAQRERAEAEAAQEQVANILESITDSFSFYDREWRVTYLNKEAEKLLPRLGLSREEVLGKNLWEVFPHLVGSVVYEQYHRAVAERVPVELEHFYPRLDAWYEVRAYPSNDGLAVYSQDISERKQAEEALRQSEQRYRQLIHALPAAIYACDTQGRVTLYNEAAVDLWGREPEVGKDLWCGSWNIYKPDGSPLPLEDCPMAIAIREGRPVLGQEIVIERPDGTRRFVLPYPDPILDASGTVVGAVNMLVDLTERKEMEQEREQLLAREQAARAEAERRWRESRSLTAATRQFSTSLQLQDLLPAICHAAREIADADGATFVLREADQVYYSEEDAIEPLWKGHRFPISACISGWAILERRPAIVEDIYADQRLPIESYQSTFVKSLVMVPVRNHDPLGAIGVYWARRRRADDREVALLEALADAAHIALINTQLYEETKAAREQAEEANRLKDEFLATVSHELRTPLNAMLGWTRMLRIGKLDEQTNERALETIERNAKSQAQLIEDLLDVSRVISGKMRLDVQPVELAPVIQAAIDSVLPAADAKSIRLSMAIDPKAGPVSGDPTRLQQIVWNLLSNAIKFTPQGGSVQVTIERVDSHLEISVRDSGIGIKPDFLPRVFDRFRQADSTLTRQQSGLGLGLAIARHLVELHGGNIYAYSPGEDHGATFTIRLPLLEARDVEHLRVEVSERKHANAWPDVPFECPPVLNGLQVLVVDDEPDARQLLTTILHQCNALVTAVGSAGEALAGLDQLKPDVLVSDIEMPGEDGYSLIRRVRAKEGGRNGRIPAAALTAHAGVADRMQALAAGFDMHVPKPVEPAELIAVIASLTSRIAKHPRS